MKYVKVDETKYWSEDVVALLGTGGRMIATYAFDDVVVFDAPRGKNTIPRSR